MQFVRVCGLIELVTTIAQLAVIECRRSLSKASASYRFLCQPQWCGYAPASGVEQSVPFMPNFAELGTQFCDQWVIRPL